MVGKIRDIAIAVSTADDSLDAVVLALSEPVGYLVDEVVQDLLTPVIEDVVQTFELSRSAALYARPPVVQFPRCFFSTLGAVDRTKGLRRVPGLSKFRVLGQELVTLMALGGREVRRGGCEQPTTA